MAKKRKNKTREPSRKGRKPTRTQPARACKRTYATGATVPDQQEQRRTLDQLPDDVLLLVMQQLDVDDLVYGCRLVCRRLGALALHPEAWRRRTLSTSSRASGSRTRLTCAVLRLAPCLHHATVVLPLTMDVCGHPLFSTTCAVRELELDVDSAFTTVSVAGTGALTARLVKRQASLGRLRRVVLKYKCNTKHEQLMSQSESSALFRTLASTPGLEELCLTAQLGVRSAISLTECKQVGCRVRSSMKRFRVAIDGVDPFSQSVLRTHAATLEEVHFGQVSWSIPVSTATLQLLAGLQSLREVAVHHDLAGVEVLARCATLRTVIITITGNEQDGHAAVDAAELLRRARQVREVNIRGGAIGCYVSAAVCTELVRGLASSARSDLERLHIACYIWRQSFRTEQEEELLQELLQALLRALPRLPALRELHVGQLSRRACEDVLLAISPATHPALRLVSVRGCGHGWARQDAVRALLTAHPDLHVRVARYWGPDNLPYGAVCDPRHPCDECKPGKQQVAGGLLQTMSSKSSATLVLEGRSASPLYHHRSRPVIFVKKLVS